MAKMIRAARHYQQRNDPLRRIADRAIPGIKTDLKDALRGVSELIPQDADRHASAGDWYAVKNSIDWGHFREVLKGVFGQIGKAREAGAQHGAQKINAAFARVGRKVRFRKAYNPDEPRDERGRWTAGDGNVVFRGSLPKTRGGETSKFDEYEHSDGRIFNYDVHYDAGGGATIAHITIQTEVDGEEGSHPAHEHLTDSELKSVMSGIAAQEKEVLRERKDEAELDKVAKDANDQYAFDLYSQEVQDELRRAQDDLIAELEQDVRDAIDQIVLDGARLGLGPEEIMDDIRSMVGLTARQSQAAMNYRDMLENLDPGALQRQLRNFLEDDNVQAAIDSGQPLDGVMVDKLTGDYIDNYIDYRAETIAQTESVRAVNEGLLDAYSQAVDRGVFPEDAVTRQWQLADHPCLICESIVDQNPDGIGINEAFDSIDGPIDNPPVHPNCMCTVNFVTDLDKVPDAEEAA